MQGHGETTGRRRTPLPALGLALTLAALAACDGNAPDIQAQDWSAITDRDWPPGDAPEERRLDADPQRTNVAVVLDMSGSMQYDDCAGGHGSKAAAARTALATWAEAVPRDANIGLIAFTEGDIRTLVPLATDNRPRFIEAAAQVRPAGGTPLRSAMATAHAMLIERAHYQLGYGRYQIVMITDGEHSEGENPLPVVEEILDNPANPVEIHTIGFCIEDSVLKQPGYVHYQSANDPEQLAAGLSSVLAESTSFQPVEDFDEE